MSEFKDKLSKELKIIDETISNEEEKNKVMGVIQDMISDFTAHLVSINERQNEIDEKISEIYESILDIQSTLEDDEMMDYLDGECPYCGEFIPIETEDGEYPSSFECPNCHKIIDIERHKNYKELDDVSFGKEKFDDYGEDDFYHDISNDYDDDFPNDFSDDFNGDDPISF